MFEGQFPDVEPMQNDSFDMIYVIHATKGRFEEHKEYLKGRIRAARKAGKKVKFLVEWGPDDNYKDKFVQELLAFYKRNPDEARREFQSYYKAAEIMFSQIIRGERTLAYLYEVISPRPTADFMYALFEFLKENHVEIVLEERNIESWVGAVYARKYQSEAFDYFIKGDFDKHLENIEKCYVYIKPADDKRDELLRSEIEQIMEEENIYLFSFRGNVHTGMEEGLMRRTYDVVTKQATDPLALEFGVDELDLKMRLGIPVSEAEKRNLLMKDNPCDLLAAYFEEVMKIDIVKARALAKGIVYSADVTEETLRELSAYLGTLEPANITRAVVYNWFDERGLVPKWVKEELTESSGVDEAIGHRSRSDDIRRFNTKACEVLEEMKLDESQAQQISIVEIKAEILDTINSEPEKEFSFEDIKKKIQLEVPNAELRGLLDELCKQGKLIKVEARLLELIRYYKEYIEPEQKQPQEKTFIERYKDSLIAVFGLTPTSQNISQIDKYLEAMRRNYEKMRQSCIANITIGKETIQHQQFALLERLAGERLNRDKIAPYFVHKLLEYITSSKLAGPSLEDFAEFMGMELGELPRAETSTRPQSINEHHLLFEKAA